ncbi:hypothetical protein TrVE_jg5784 [Triparma verrucosa]|uniref:Secreted protein n=1 Tax=Triparma verrucosa TaxID=1606542 RepID=A0A9W7BWH6_9STRA|nr:hypothetical protein TrVE_jg5784 [Triparma verrucosa]
MSLTAACFLASLASLKLVKTRSSSKTGLRSLISLIAGYFSKYSPTASSLLPDVLDKKSKPFAKAMQSDCVRWVVLSQEGKDETSFHGLMTSQRRKRSTFRSPCKGIEEDALTILLTWDWGMFVAEACASALFATSRSFFVAVSSSRNSNISEL